MEAVYNRDCLDDTDFAVVLFDGVCNFCSSSVNFLTGRDLQGRLKFGSLQSEAGHRILKDYEISSDTIDSIVFIDDNKAYFRSEAILRIAWKLGGLWKLFYPPYIP